MDKLVNAFAAPEPLFLIVLGILIAESAAWFTLQRWYFNDGLPLFRREVKAQLPKNDIDQWLQSIQPKSFWGEFHFKAFDAGLVGIRESLGLRHVWRPSYTPLMRAVLLIDRTRGTVKLTGYANYSALLLIPLLLLASLQKAISPLTAIPALLIIGGIAVGIYTIQHHRYERLLAALAEQGRLKTVSAP